MLTDSMTLYKLMILYMLNHVNFPLTNNQISEFFLNKSYTNYSNLQKAISELLEAELIVMENTHNSSRYMSSSSGKQTLEYFESDIPHDIINDISNYLKENSFKMRSESSSSAVYYKTENNDYMLHFEIREAKDLLIGLDIIAPNEEQAIKMSSNWDKCGEDIYQTVMMKLISNKN